MNPSRANRLTLLILAILILGSFALIFYYQRQTKVDPTQNSSTNIADSAATGELPPNLDTTLSPIINLAANSEITSPQSVSGSIPATWAEEGSFTLRLVDTQGNILAEQEIREESPGAWSVGNAVNFAATLTWTSDASSGFLILQKSNISGLPENSASIDLPVTIKN